MTNEEAKEVLAMYRFKLIQSISNQLEGDIEAFDVAIKALEQQPSREWKDIYAESEGSNSWIEFKCPHCGYSFGMESGEYGWHYGDEIPWKYCPICGGSAEHKPYEAESEGQRMTPQEAIEELRDASDSEVRYGDKDNHYDKVMKRVEAFEMAIKALGTQSCDCVSRKDVIILIDEATELHPYKVIGDSETYSNYNQGWEDACNWLYANIDSDNLKSVTPQQKVGKWTCTDDMDEWYGKLFRCSVCGAKVLEADRYCPYCGAKMEVDK